jgi:hypothetical protein
MDKRPLPSEDLIYGEEFNVGGDVRPLDTSRGQQSGATQYYGASRRDVGTDVYNSFRRTGFSHQQALALTAEINRENNFNPNFLFGSHLDPHNRATNVGMLSWQGDRADRVMSFLGEQGLLDESGRIKQTPEALDAQAQYLRWEMETQPEYARTREQFLANPDVDYDTAHTVLGDNFIRWRRKDPQYRDSGYGRIDEGYALLTGDGADSLTPRMSTSGGMSTPPPARPDDLKKPEESSPFDDLTDALQYLELPESPPEMSAPASPGILRPRRGDTGTRALQRFGIASLA